MLNENRAYQSFPAILESMLVYRSGKAPYCNNREDRF